LAASIVKPSSKESPRMGRTRRARAGRHPLTRDRILAAALELADADGIGAVTMQGVGRRLGVEAMSLYRHVDNKEAILDGLVDLIVSEVDLPPRTGGWKRAMRTRAISAHRVFGRHAWAIGLVESRTRPGAATLRHHEAVLGVLLDAGFSGVQAARTYTLLDSYIYGFAFQGASLPFDDAEEQARLGEELLGLLPADAYPNVARVATEFLAAGPDVGAFEFGLDLILDGIERAKRATARGARR
jgi:AcrR family transcriptional regulator